MTAVLDWHVGAVVLDSIGAATAGPAPLPDWDRVAAAVLEAEQAGRPVGPHVADTLSVNRRRAKYLVAEWRQLTGRHVPAPARAERVSGAVIPRGGARHGVLPVALTVDQVAELIERGEL